MMNQENKNIQTTPSSDAPVSVEFRNIIKAYGDVHAVDDVSFKIHKGELVTVLGPSGCGKTTTLRMIAGLELPTSGSIHIGGDDVTRLTATHRDVSMVFQSYALFPHMNVIQNVSYGLVVSGMKKADAAVKAEIALKTVGLEGFGQRLPSELSGGQQQRVAVARALVLEPEVLLFDEPLSNLDAKLRRHMREEIRALQQNLNLTAVYVTHDQEEAMAVSDRIIVMKNAVIAQEGTPRDLYERPKNKFVASFIGEANLVETKAEKVEGNLYKVTLDNVVKFIEQDNLVENKTTWAVLRPEGIKLHAEQGENRLKVTAKLATYLGSHYEYEFESSLGILFTTSADFGFTPKEGDDVYIEFSDTGFYLVQE